MGDAAEEMDTSHEVVELPLDQLVRFRKNRTIDRKAPKYLELVESLRENGQLTPAIVRPVEGRPSEYEVLAGERRWSGTADLGRRTLLCIVRRDLEGDDDQAHKVALIENLQREDLTPVEEGDAFNALLEDTSKTVADVASAVGRSETYVRERLRIRELAPELRAWVDERKIDLGAALTLAQAAPVAQKRVVARLTKVLAEQDHIRQSDVRSILQHENVTRSLHGVTWDLDDATLVPEAGPCSRCPKRTGEQRSLIADVVGRDDVCLDESCYAEKSQAQWVVTAEEAKKKGLKVLSAKESEKVIQYGQARYDSKYYAAQQHVYEAGASGEAGKLAPDAPRVIARGEGGQPIELIEKKHVKAAAKGGKGSGGGASARSVAASKAVETRHANEAARQKEKAALDRRVAEIVLADVEKALDAKELKLGTMLLRVALDGIRVGRDGDVHVEHVRKTKDLAEVARKLAEAPGGEAEVLRGLVLLMYQQLVASALPEGYYKGDAKVAKELGIDLAKVQQRATSAIAAEKIAGKAAPAAKGKARK